MEKEIENFYEHIRFFGVSGITVWTCVLCIFICTKVRLIWLKRLNMQWVKSYERRTNTTIAQLIENSEKAVKAFKKLLRFHDVLTILFSLDFLVQFLLENPCSRIALSGFIVAGICIPMRLDIILLSILIDDKRKRIIEVMKETRSGATGRPLR